MLKKLALMFGLITSGCSGVQPSADPQPEMDFLSYFEGKVDGWGVMYDWRGRVTDKFHILMDGKITNRENGDAHLRLDETFSYSDGRTMERYWEVTKKADGTYEAFAPEVPNGVKAVELEDTISFRYTFNAPVGKRVIALKMDDRMWMIDEDTVMNKNVFKKFGIKVGELNILFRKRNEG